MTRHTAPCNVFGSDMEKSKIESQPPAYEDLDNAPPPPESTHPSQIYIDEADTTAAQSTSTPDGQSNINAQLRRPRTQIYKIKLVIIGAILFIASYKLGFALNARGQCSHRKHCSHTGSSDQVTAVPYNKRIIRIHENTRSINGHFPLYDLLDLSTVTGSIDITIAPIPGPNPAVLRLRSLTGSITVNLRSDYLNYDPEATERNHRELPVLYDDITTYLASLARRFDTEISTNTGSITVTHLVGGGGTMSVSSQTGSLDLDLRAVNVAAGDPVAELRTETRTGQQNIEVKTFTLGDGKMVKLKGVHRSLATGSVDVRYPAEWEGRVEASVVGSGSIDVDGDGLIVDEDNYGRYVKAHRGEGAAIVSLSVIGSASLKFRC